MRPLDSARMLLFVEFGDSFSLQMSSSCAWEKHYPSERRVVEVRAEVRGGRDLLWGSQANLRGLKSWSWWSEVSSFFLQNLPRSFYVWMSVSQKTPVRLVIWDPAGFWGPMEESLDLPNLPVNLTTLEGRNLMEGSHVGRYRQEVAVRHGQRILLES